MEYGTYLKIGSTTDINRRYKELVRQANYYSNINIGKVYFTVEHDKFLENEKRLHKLFSKYRRENTELFNVSLESFFDAVKNFEFNFEKNKHDSNLIDIVKKSIWNEQSFMKLNCFYSKKELDDIFRSTYCPYCNDDEFNEVMYIISLINKPDNPTNYFLYLLTKMQNIIFQSHERYLETII